MITAVMKKLLIAIFLLVPLVAAGQNNTQLASNMEVSDPAAWKTLRARMQKIHKKRPVVALVLGGGGAKGCAHVGVIKHLEEIGMPVDMVLGTSMGALVGGLYSLGYNSEEMDSLVSQMDWPKIMSDKIPDEFVSLQNRRYKEKYQLSFPFDLSKDGFKRSIPSAYIQGQNVGNLLSSLTVGYQDNMRFCDLPIPFVCISTDLIKGTGIVWTGGNLLDAMRTTMSIPLVFAPTKKDGRFLVDGGMIDNFPSDVAKALGADIIIGVSVGSPSVGYSEASNFLDVVSLSIDLSGKLRLEENLKIPDTVIYPDIEGLNALSFSTENVRKLVANGYKAACDSSAVLKELRSRVAGAEFALHAPKARNLLKDTLDISSLRFEGLPQREVEILYEYLDIDGKKSVTGDDVSRNVTRIYGTNVFSTVGFKVEGKGPQYDLVFNCHKRPQHRFGLGLRLDSEEMASAMVNLGFFNNSLGGSRVNVDLRISANPYGRVEYSYNLPRVPRICAAADVRYANTSLMAYAVSPFNMTYVSSNQEVYLTDLGISRFDIKLGFRNTVAKVFSATHDEGIADPLRPTVFTGVFANFSGNTMKGGLYFPVSGVRYELNYSWQFKSNRKEGETFRQTNMHEALANVKTAWTPADYFTFIFCGDVRMIFGADMSALPLYVRNFAGGMLRGRYVDHQIDFPCIENVLLLKSKMAALRADFRFKMASKHYLTPRAMLAVHTDNLGDWGYDRSTFVDEHLVYGAALEYSLSTIIGPVKVFAGWNNATMHSSTRGFDLGVSVGFDF